MAITDLITDISGIEQTAWLNGGIAFKVRAMQMLISMGERDLATTIGRMPVPTKENWSDREATRADAG